MVYDITLIIGDGTGPEVTGAAKACLNAVLPGKFKWHDYIAGETALKKLGTPLPKDLVESIRRTDCTIKGPLSTLKTYRSINVTLREEFDLYACVRPIRWREGYPKILASDQKIDFVIMRENTEDLYVGVEFEADSSEAQEIIGAANTFQQRKGRRTISPNSAIALKPITPAASERLMKFSMGYALKHGRKTVSVVAKDNILPLTEGLFKETALAYAQKNAGKYPGITVDNYITDAAGAAMILHPDWFEVMLLTNMSGDLYSDVGAALIGGLGLAPGANIGDRYAIFEAIHGSWPKAAGQDIVNPSAVILSGVMMLNHLGETKAAETLDEAVHSVIKERQYVTPDLKGTAGTRRMTKAIIDKINYLK